MQAKPSPLEVFINPAGIQDANPGDTIELHVVVSNVGKKDAMIDLYLNCDEQFRNITGLSTVPRESCAIAPQQSSDEIKFTFEISLDAIPGTYDYTLVVDAPQHYPQETPIPFTRQLKIVPKEHTSIGLNDPTFSIQPSSNPAKPLICKLHEPLLLEVTVENRSKIVDRFRLSCLDLDDDWFTITYPETGVEGAGLISDINGLGLNPGDSGKISLKFHPPVDTLAGSYTPTLRLYSENLPDLVLLDLVYLQIPTSYDLNVELKTILGQVSRSPGKYELFLSNRGNMVRELIFGVESRDEETLFTYTFDPAEIRLLPNKSAETNLLVKPRPWWRRPWFGGGQTINFKVNLVDQENLPLPDILAQGTLLWKPRPLWQLILLILLILGLLGGIGFIIWRILNPPQLKIENFSVNSTQLIEGEDEVTLNWEIRNYKKLENLIVLVKGPQAIKPTIYDFRNKIPEELNNNNCLVQRQVDLSCKNVKTGISTKGNYTFGLQGLYRKGNVLFSETAKIDSPAIQVVINEKPIAEIVDFKVSKPQYQSGENILVNWTIANPELLAETQIIGSTEEGTATGNPIIYKFNQGIIDNPKLNKACKEVNRQLQCTNIPIPPLKAGKYAFELKAVPNNGSEKVSGKKTEGKIEVLPKPFKIVAFTINGSEQPNQSLKEGETAVLSWRVEGEDIQVKLLPYGNDVAPVGSLKLPVIAEFPPQIAIQVVDKSGKQQPQQRGFAIAVIKKPVPTLPPIIPSVPSPTPASPFKPGF
ncbi:hypothetical protein H6G33_23815 [Calothrix sp. FACHB-1219]|uniref:COG1470 family protein n=1 Tax=unclassified Calothrix TaxID=2619626 RepID=UPI00168264FC|nr:MULTISPECIES: hypothetical protein [unclassified Calothrix]MBD2205263.1 hypothetical protein [Calothrix sp. FACHB-168]MBD2220037.1 hypothetical protein [Calothrix sp. FACHB-1219]